MGSHRFDYFEGWGCFHPIQTCARLASLIAVLTLPVSGAPGDVATAAPPDERAFFTTQVLPILSANCFECHAHDQKIKGGLALDSPAGLRQGGEGGPIVVSGRPEASRLIIAVQHVDKEFQMPPKAKLTNDEIATLTTWIRHGAHDPREEGAAPDSTTEDSWETVFQARRSWWSLQPITDPAPPTIQAEQWPGNDVDRFILAALENKGLAPVARATPRARVRRLSYALTGLPPSPEVVEAFAAHPTAEAYEALVDTFLESPHFGERWARHWMDVVHYADTHGYEWDAPAKNAWRYRDYLIRAYNNDISFRQLILEQIAGDQIAPRVDPETGLNESIIGPMALRMGERRHGDNAQTEGVTQEAVANMIDTVSKGFIATTVGCAQCHDHKIDAVAQKDYYSLAGVLMSSRWTVRSAEAVDPNAPVIDELRAIKGDLKSALGTHWRDARATVAERIATPPEVAQEKDAASAPPASRPFPESAPAIRDYIRAKVGAGETMESAWLALAKEFHAVRALRQANNQERSTLVADFREATLPEGWQMDGLGMKYGLVTDGALVVADEGDQAIAQLLPAGRWSHVWSKRLGGALRSDLFDQDPPPTMSLAYAGGDYAAQSLVVDNAFHSERMQFLKRPQPGWLTFTAGNLVALAGGPDTTPRQIYLEMVTKSFNNYYPPRDNYGGLAQAVENDPRSWFGVMGAYAVKDGYTPEDTLGRFEALFTHGVPPNNEADLADRLTAAILASVEHWHVGTADSEDVQLINEALVAGWLPNDLGATEAIADIIARYRATEQRLQPERTIGSADDWREGQDARIGIRGSYTTFGEEVPRGTIRFLDALGHRDDLPSAGRLELAQSFVAEDNPLTARVYVNRIWYHLFGAGLVRTVDDFGRLGETPSHPELLDWLARRFMEEDWSTKKLIRLLVTSATWQQDSIPRAGANDIDPDNRFLHHMPLRRLEAEAIRDAMLATSGTLDARRFGAPINPYRVAEDSTKRLYAGPLDGDGRRSIYQKMTLMEPPRFLAVFNQPIPRLTTGRRDATNVPNQALAMLNDPFVIAMAERWAQRLLEDGSNTPEERINTMFALAFARHPNEAERARFVEFAHATAQLHGVSAVSLMDCQPVWQDVAHAIFNVKEFIYVP